MPEVLQHVVDVASTRWCKTAGFLDCMDNCKDGMQSVCSLAMDV